jgi:TPP-dependent pyruvate/acetoin dehydrogenase alpha subunit
MVESGEARCPCHLYIGQEAIAAGVCAALRRTDTVWGGHRSHGHYLAKGGSLEAMFAEILGKETGCSLGRGGSMHLMSPSQGILGTVPIVAATVPLAVGAAMAYKMRQEQRVAVAFFGDGTLEEGHVHESFNLAALYRLPVVFICENNLYASHMHWSERRVADNLHEAGLFHSVPGERLDGNDVTQVGESARRAVELARQGGGPTLLECRTFRWRGHVGSSFDLDVGVERRGELSSWLQRDPLGRAERELGTSLGMTRAAEAIQAEIEQALDAARHAPAPYAGRVLEHVFVQEASCGR